jgi:two-component system, cell cycle sensor histidine kinase and response regulator CckA
VTAGGHRRRFTILIVDDEPTLRGLVRFLLVGAGYDVLRARSVREALEALTAIPGPIDLVLVDMDLPGTAEQELAHHAAARAHPARLLYMSSLSRDERTGSGLADADVIHKPIEAGALLERIRAVLGDERH